MQGWILWLIAACVFGIGEMLTTGFFLAPFALGAGLAALTDAVGAGDVASWVVFVLVSLLTLAIVRPIAKSHMKMPPHIRTGSAALIGKQAIVLERIVNDEGVGCVKIDGEVWTARSYDEDEVIEKGKRVQVMEIRGATALVAE
jgi:membrane protein implicated in regulation of membrane protease activity